MRFIYIIALIALFAAQNLIAAEANVVRSYTSAAGDVLALSSDPCTTMTGFFAQFPLEDRKPELKAGKMIWKGKPLDVCWLKGPKGETLVVDETGEAGVIEGSPFDPKGQIGVSI